MESINTLDIVILAVVGISAIVGLFRGFVREVLSLAAWAGAAWIALTFHEPAKALVLRVIDDPQWAGILAGAGLFILALILFMVIAGFLSRGVKRTTMLGPADRTLGLVFGVLRGVVVLALSYLGVVNTLELYRQPGEGDDRLPVWVETSRLLPHVRAAASLVERLAPKDLLPADRKNRQDSP
jgi:membrane protein required for colicin V production